MQPKTAMSLLTNVQLWHRTWLWWDKSHQNCYKTQLGGWVSSFWLYGSAWYWPNQPRVIGTNMKSIDSEIIDSKNMQRNSNKYCRRSSWCSRINDRIFLKEKVSDPQRVIFDGFYALLYVFLQFYRIISLKKKNWGEFAWNLLKKHWKTINRNLKDF